MTYAPEKSSWQERRRRRQLILSATQIENFRLCPRKWWLEKVRQLPIPVIAGGPFGTCLHGVCERYELANDLGIDPKTGRPVNLYPDDWHIAADRHTGEVEGTITLAEQDLIRKLIHAAITEGILDRPPGRRVESPFNLNLGQIAGTTVRMVGYRDIWAPPGDIRDHKTTKSTRYIKSPKQLAKNTPMLIYAQACILDLMKENLPIPGTLNLRHNAFVKDPEAPLVRKVDTTVTLDQVKEHWDSVMADAKQMVIYRDGVEMWHEIPDPKNHSESCNAYGGCPFQSICTGRESEQGYQCRVDNASHFVQNTLLGIHPPFTGKDTTMSNNGQSAAFAARMAQRQAMNQGQAAPAQVQAPVQQAPVQQMQAPVQQNWPPQQQVQQPVQQAPVQQVQQPAPQQAPVQQPIQQAPLAIQPPPWAVPGCPACGGSGFSTTGKPCRICDGATAKAGRPNSLAFTLKALGNGTVQWTLDSNPAFAGISPLPVETAPVQTQERVQMAPQQAPAPQSVQQPQNWPPPPTQYVTPQQQAIAQPVQQAPVQVHQAMPTPPVQQATLPAPEQDSGSGKGRPKKGFILCINCAPIRGEQRTGSGRKVHYLPEIMAEIGAQMAQQNNVGSYYELDAFRRRDALAAQAPVMAEKFGADIVVAPTCANGTDLKALVDALRPLAGMEIIGLTN